MALFNTSMLVGGFSANRGSEKAFDFGMFSQFRSRIVKLEGGMNRWAPSRLQTKNSSMKRR
jgi:hypothetical protein